MGHTGAIAQRHKSLPGKAGPGFDSQPPSPEKNLILIFTFLNIPFKVKVLMQLQFFNYVHELILSISIY